MDLRHAPEARRWLQRYRVIACIRHSYEAIWQACREFLRQKAEPPRWVAHNRHHLQIRLLAIQAELRRGCP